MHTGEPHEGHHKLLADLKGRLGQAGLLGVSDIEQIAILAQIIGAKVADLDQRQFDVNEVMRSVSLNIAAGNQGDSLIGAGRS